MPYGNAENTTPSVTEYLGIARVNKKDEYDDFMAILRPLFSRYGLQQSFDFVEDIELNGVEHEDVGIWMRDEDVALQMKGELDGMVIMGKKLQIKFATPW